MGAVLRMRLPTEAGLKRELTVSDVDRISHALGQLMAEAEEGRRQRALFDDKIDRLEREHAQIASILRAHVADSERRQQELNKHFEHVVSPTLEDYKGMKQRAIGVLMVVATLGAGLAEVVRYFFMKAIG